jgi:hypothetical protein
MYKAAVAFVGSMLFLVVDYIPIPEGFTLQLLKFGIILSDSYPDCTNLYRSLNVTIFGNSKESF